MTDTNHDHLEAMFSRKSETRLSAEQLQKSRKIESLILQSAHKTRIVAIADAFCVHETTAGRWINDGHVKFIADLLAVIELDVVPKEQAFDPKVVEALMTLAGTRLNQAVGAVELCNSLK